MHSPLRPHSTLKPQHAPQAMDTGQPCSDQRGRGGEKNGITMLMQTNKETKHGHSQAFCSLGCYWVVLETMRPRNQTHKNLWINALHNYLKKSTNEVSMLMVPHPVSPSTSDDLVSRNKVCKQIMWLTKNWILKQKKNVWQFSCSIWTQQTSNKRGQVKQFKRKRDQVGALPTPARKCLRKITSVVVLSLIHNSHCQIQSEK